MRGKAERRSATAKTGRAGASRVATDAFADFTRELDVAVAAAGDDARTIVASAERLLRRLLEDMRWLAPEHYALGSEEAVEYALYHHPTDACRVSSLVFAPGKSTGVHEHGTWGVVGVWRGEEREEQYRPLDGEGRGIGARFERCSVTINRPGTVTTFLPPADVHRIHNPGPGPAYSIHIYGPNPDVHLLEVDGEIAIRPNRELGFAELMAALRQRGDREPPQPARGAGR